MIKTRGKKIIRDVLSRKGRTALVAISILIGVFGAVTLISANDLLVRQIRADINPDEVAMTRLLVTVPAAGTDVTTETGEDQVLDLIRNRRAIPGVTRIEGQVAVPVYWQEASGERFREADLLAYSEPFDEIQLEPMRLVEGEWPQPGQHQIALERRMADEYGLGVGDTISFRVLGSEQASESWTITAIVFHPYWVAIGDNPNQPEQRFYANLDDARLIAQFSGFTMFNLRYIDTGVSESQADRLMEAVAQQTNYIPTHYWLDDPDDYFLIGEVAEVTSILNMLAVVALIVSGFLVMNVINTIVVEQKRQIGVMKSLGATRLDNFIIYAGIALVYGILGTIPGVILGVIVGGAMAQEVAPFAFTLIEGFKISPMGVIVGVVMGLFVPVAAAFVPVFNGTRVTIRDAMTDLGIAGTWGRGLTARVIKALPVPITIRQALSNVVQKKGRLALTVITLTLAAAAFMGVFAMFTVINAEITKLFETFQYEIMVIPSEAQDFTQISQRIGSVDGVKAVDPGVGFLVRLYDLSGTAISIGAGFEGSDELQAYGYDPRTTGFSLTYDKGSGWRDDPTRPGVVLTSAAAEAVGKTVGDRIVVSAGGRTAEYEIIGVASYPFPFVLMNWQDLARQVGFVLNDAGTPGDFSDDPPLPNAYMVTLTAEDPSAAEVEDVIADISDALVADRVTASFFNQVQQQEDMTEGMLVFNMIFQITSAVMAAVGAIGLLTTLSMAVYERQKEIGVMRSIGAGSGTIITQFLVEGILIGVLAWVLAVPLSYLLAVSLLDGLGFADFIEFSYPLWVLGLGLVGMIIVATVASLWPSIAAARRTVSDILRYQ
ncbi:MAG: ABC transporter permease [Anaerolineae bacterium]|nr:ABC transporter permease [Anaerolineae bacterium]